MPRFLVTGAAGFIGCNLVRALLKLGHGVRGIDNFATGARANIANLDGLQFIEADICDPAALAHAMQNIDYVLHQAAMPSVPRSVAEPMISHEANATGTLNILEAARHDGNVKKVVYASSSSVYGDTPTSPKVETMPTRPQSPYAVAKLAGEHYGLVYDQIYGVPCTALRYFNVFGPRQAPEPTYARVIPQFVSCMLRNERPVIFGNGEQTRDFTYIDNVIEANLAACMSEGASGRAINVGSGVSVDLIRLVSMLNKILGKQLEPIFGDARAGDVRRSCADIGLAREVLNYKGSVSLQKGLERYVEWFQRQAG